MTIRKRRVSGLVLDADHNIGEIRAPAGSFTEFGKLLEFRARNFADATLAGAGVDVLEKVRITDANGDVVYLDAADRDYATAEVTVVPVLDDTATGLGKTATDATGAARAAGEASTGIPVEFPLQVDVVGGATATDFFVLDAIVEV